MGELDGRDIEPRILFLDSSSLIPIPCFPIQGKGFGNQGSVSLPVGGVGEGCRLASAGAAGAVFLLLLEFIYTHHTRAAAELRK